MRTIILSALTLGALPLGAQTPTDPIDPDPHWVNRYIDDFSTSSGMNTTCWEIYDCHLKGVTLNIPDEIGLGGGGNPVELKIRPGTDLSCSQDPSTYGYLSNQIGSPWWTDARDMRYGYIEATMALDDQNGLWPCFWLFRNEENIPGLGPDYEEVDIMEPTPGADDADGVPLDRFDMGTNTHDNPDELNGFVNTYACGTPMEGGRDVYINDYTLEHDYGLEWSPDKLIWYVDQEIVRVTQNINDPCDPLAGFHYAMGVSFDHWMKPELAPGNPLQEAIVSISRVQLWDYDMANCGTPLSITSQAAFNAYQPKVWQSITIDPGSVITQSSAGPKHLRAGTVVDIVKNFVVPQGESLYIDANTCYTPLQTATCPP